MFTSTEIQQTIPKHTTQNTAAGIHNTYEMGNSWSFKLDSDNKSCICYKYCLCSAISNTVQENIFNHNKYLNLFRLL